mgnify:FL=1
MTIDWLVEENNRRNDDMHAHFDPIKGENSPGTREMVEISDMYPYKMLLPVSMLPNKLVKRIIRYKSIRAFCKVTFKRYDEELHEKVVRQFIKVRNKHDFPFWAYSFCEIKNKEGGKNIHFKLNYPQRLLLSVMEDMRLAGLPIRIILLKARQWGGSTLVQLYIAWIQLCHKEAWYSTIVAQDASTSRKIKAMYSKMLEKYPTWLLDLPDNVTLGFTPYEGSQLDSIITYGKGSNVEKARDTVITIGTYNSPNSGRGGDMSCVHYSEVGLWDDTDGKTPEDIIRSISSSLLLAPLTVEVIESTANGMGNFFYRSCVAAKKGKSNRRFVFVPWFKIERYELPVKDKRAFAKWLLDNKENDNPPDGCLDPGKYYWRLWKLGASFEAINWYLVKRKDFMEHADMAAEFPSDDVEAFKNSGNMVFSVYHIDKLKEGCKPPKYVGEISGKSVKGKSALTELSFKEDHNGSLKVWSLPDDQANVKNRYLVIVDIGGRGKKSDFSDILVIDRYWMMFGGKPEVVAEWHGHIDHDLLAWKSAQIAKFFGNALLVIESNTIETKDNDTDGDQSELIFNQIGDAYDNLYARKASEAKIRAGKLTEWGFHTNRNTKPMIISYLVACLREQSYIERDIDTLDEMSTYEKKANGSFGAVEGKHDDKVMTRAIGLYICYCDMDLPSIPKDKSPGVRPHGPISEATI